MIELTKCNRLLDEGFSLLTVGESKKPNFAWSKLQDKALTKQQFEKQYNYKGGIIKKDGQELAPTNNIGIITGYNYLECIDIDLKVFSTAKEQVAFWDEYLSFLKDNILDFDDKFTIYKTQNNGYHILYKSKRIEGNTKIACLKGHKEAVIESRGKGGYIFVYEKNISKNTYIDIDFISDEDRDILWSVSRTYNFVDDAIIEVPRKEYKNYESTGLNPWDDYNERTSILDIISDDFKIVRNVNDKYIIKRHGSKAAHSGYVYKDSGCMYLFTTATLYPHEKLISPFAAFCYSKFNGDFSEGAKEIYKQGFGERLKPQPILKSVNIKYDKKDLTFPLDVFPEQIQNYILVCNSTLNSSIDFMACSMLWMTSILIGNSINIEVKRGWIESANVWIALIGKAGIGKTPSISNVTFPMQKKNSKEIKSYIKNSAKYDEYKELDKQQQQLTEEIKRPTKTQFIVNDITLEALVELHGENKNGIGVLKDELAGWFKDMNKYRQGSDLEHWLSSWSGKEINLNRKTAKSSFVERAFIPVLGGIQPGIMDGFYTEDNKDNGFIDRMLFCYPDLEVDRYNEEEMKQEYLDWYSDYVLNFYEKLKHLIEFTEDKEIDPIISRFSEDANKEWVRIFNKITDVQNSDEENEYMKSMLPKQKAYIPRFALLINTLSSYSDDSYTLGVIKKDSVLKAEKLSNYFISMAKKIKVNSLETKDVKTILNKNADKSSYDKFVAIYSSNPKISKTKLSEILGITRRTVYNYIKDFENKTDK